MVLSTEETAEIPTGILNCEPELITKKLPGEVPTNSDTDGGMAVGSFLQDCMPMASRARNDVYRRIFMRIESRLTSKQIVLSDNADFAPCFHLP
jgi:hypothetical protein